MWRFLLFLFSFQLFETMSSKSPKTDTSRWPAALHNATGDELEGYRRLAEEQVGNLVNAKHMECEEWGPRKWCGGKTRSGGAKFWFMFGCAPSEGGTCSGMAGEVSFQSDTLLAVERRISSDEGFHSLLFLKSFVKTVLGAANATLGLEEDAFTMRLFHSNVSPTKAPPILPFWAYISFLNFPYIFLYHLSTTLPWLLLDFAPITDPNFFILRALHIIILTLAAMPFVRYPRYAIAISGCFVFLSQLTLSAFAVFAISLLLAKLD